MTRKCNCSGGNCRPQGDDFSRREFLTIAGTGAAATLLTGTALADWIGRQASSEEVVRWRKALLQPAPARVYRSEVHHDARMHLGGIGTGNVEIGCDGQFTTWQLFNTLRDGHVPLSFAVKAGAVSRLLQTAGGPNWQRVKRIEMTGEYPIATLRYMDPELPVKLELSAFTPFAPLDSKFSSQPLAAMVFRVENPTADSQTVSLAGMLQNAVGYDAFGPTEPKFGGNVNEPFVDGSATGLLMRAEPGKEAAIDKPATIYVSDRLNGIVGVPPERPESFHVATIPGGNGTPGNSIEAIKVSRPTETVIWLEECPANLSMSSLLAARRLVEAGATLVFSGKTMPLVEAYARYCNADSSVVPKVRPDVVFEDFENGYKNWKVEGTAFGSEPAAGTLPGQQHVTGYQGKRLVNSFVGGDDATGRLVGRPFTIERKYIHFLIGGGSHPTTQLRLLVDGKVVRAASGKNDEHLIAEIWDVQELAGKKAHLEIVDQQKGPWGHINVDHIVFSDEIGLQETSKQLAELLPARFSRVAAAPGKQPNEPNSLVFENLRLHSSAKAVSLRGGFDVLVRQLGKGQVVLATGPILPPDRCEWADLRHRAYAALCELMGVKYTGPQGVPASACGFGTLALAALGQGVTVLPACEDLDVAWKQFERLGKFLPAAEAKPNPPTAAGQIVNGAVAVEVTVPAGGSVEVPFLLAWRYPNNYKPGNFWAPNEASRLWLGCHYATLWDDARAVIHQAAAGWSQLRQRTEAFRKTFYDSTLPYWMLDCITSQAATIRHIGIVFQLADGDIYGWEGSNGCCDPTCTHVWGYEQSLARLFPDLEKIMRRIDFKHQQGADGGVNNRTAIPVQPKPSGERPFVDGHASCVLKAYREALNHADDSFFKEYWSHVKRAVEYLIARDAASNGGKPQGVLLDDQFNTYDEALHGVTSFMSGYYLAALRAGEEWAKRMGDETAASRFHKVFLAGQDAIVRRCWNGEYFQQDLPDYLKRHGEVGPGCIADQLIGQWWAHQLGLGYILPKEKVQSALRSVFKYNWVPDLTGFKHMPRAFAGAKDKGLLICTWPKGGRPPEVMLYSDEVWTGIEYQVAAHMIYEGLIEESLAVVRGARDRYDGIPRPPIGRNPWNEIECGGHYARAMSSWSLLLAASGFRCDGPAGTIEFAPNVTPERFKAFFAGPEGWGTLEQVRNGGGQRNEVRVVEGRLPVATVRLSPPAAAGQAGVTLAGAKVPASLKAVEGGVLVTLASPIVVKAGDALVIALS